VGKEEHMNDLVSRLARELPDTDKDRYDVAYQRGRAQARSSSVFGGLAIGLAAGAAATFLLDPERGGARRAEIARRATAVWSELTRIVVDRVRDLREPATGDAPELDVPGTRGFEADRADGRLPVVTEPFTSRTPARSAAAPAITAADDILEREPVGAGVPQR
jgi:hypothetical protein